MRVEVTEDLIDQGVAGSCCDCPVALGILVADDKLIDVQVDGNAASLVYSEGLTVKVDLPQIARDWIEVFDGEFHHCEPFSFDLDVPCEPSLN